MRLSLHRRRELVHEMREEIRLPFQRRIERPKRREQHAADGPDRNGWQAGAGSPGSDGGCHGQHEDKGDHVGGEHAWIGLSRPVRGAHRAQGHPAENAVGDAEAGSEAQADVGDQRQPQQYRDRDHGDGDAASANVIDAVGDGQYPRV